MTTIDTQAEITQQLTEATNTNPELDRLACGQCQGMVLT